MKIIREKKHRLSHENYQGFTIVSYTKCVQERKRLFTTDQVVEVFEKYLLQELAAGRCDALVYLFMPDRAHFILQGKTADSNSLDVMYRYSQKTGYWLSKNYPTFKWQKDFYDHIIRKEEDLKKHIYYVLKNPVRQNLVKYWKDYPFKGSTVYSFDEWD